MLTKFTYQRLLEWAAVLYLYLAQLIVGAALWNTPNSPLFTKLSQETGFNSWHVVFATFSLIGAASTVILVLPSTQNKRPLWKRTAYILCGLPLAFYGALSAWYLIQTRSHNWIGIFVLGIIYSVLWVLAGAIWRPNKYKL